MHRIMSARRRAMSMASPVALGVALSLGHAISADAQAAAAASPQKVQLEEVIVTARRSAENVQDVPLSVTALSGRDITRANIVSPQDLNSRVPSLSISTSNMNRDSAIYSIRGQGQAFGGSEPAVITYFAEVPTDMAGPGYLFDLQNVQVLKGPQGTLFGRNTTGGAVLIEPQHPVNSLGGFGQVSVGDYGLRRFQGAVNVPLVDDKLLLRLAVDLNHRDGFTKDAVTGADYDNRNYQAYRLGLVFNPTAGVSNYLLLNGSVSRTHGAGAVLESVNPNSLAALAFPNFTQLLAQQQARGVRSVAHSTPNSFDDIDTWGATNTTTVDLPAGMGFKNIFGYRAFRQRNNADIDGSALPLVDYVASPFYLSGSSSQPSQKATSDEMQLHGVALHDSVKWVVGLYGEYIGPNSQNDKDLITQFATGPFILQSLKQDRSKAAFAQATYAFHGLLEGVHLTGGVRRTDDWRSQTTSQYLVTPAICTMTPPTPTCRARDAAGFGATTWNVSADYHPTDKVMLYVTGRHGYKSGGFNTDSPQASNRIFAPETVTDVEAGAKTEFSVGIAKVRADLDIYRGDFQHIQENAIIFDAASGQALSITENLGDAVIQGAELEWTVIPGDGLEFNGFYAYTDAHYTHNIVPSPSGPENLDDLPFSNTPKTKAGVTARYIYQLGSPGALSADVSYRYQSRVYFQVPIGPVNLDDPHAGQDGYSLVDLRVDWRGVFGRKVDLGAFVTNVANKTYKISETSFYPTPVGSTAALYGEPRMFGFDIKYQY